MSTIAHTTEADLHDLLTRYPDLGYEGWRVHGTSETLHQESRKQLLQAHVALELCRRVFREPRFRQEYTGLQSAYHLKHVVESWDFAFVPTAPIGRRRRSPERPASAYNGVYVPESVAAAAGMLEGFVSTRRHPAAPGSVIDVLPQA
jgi:hypothetical protein